MFVCSRCGGLGWVYVPDLEPEVCFGGCKRAILGVTISEDYPGQGVEVEEVLPGSAAEEAGILAGDIILEMDGEEIEDGSQLAVLTSARDAGDSVTLTVSRQGQNLIVTVTLGDMSGLGG